MEQRDLSFVIASTEQEKRAIFEALTEHRRARFKATGRTDILDEPAYQRFYTRWFSKVWRQS